MKRFTLSIMFLAGLVFTIYLHNALAAMTLPPPPPRSPQRIASLAPSVTETLYAIGMGEQVVGVTEYCRFPPDVASKPKVAGFSNVNYEAVLRLKPDLVALPQDKLRNKVNLERLGLTVLTLNTRSLEGLMETIRRLGEATGSQDEAKKTINRLNISIKEARAKAEGRHKPRVLFSIMHSYQGLGYITQINAVGRDGFFSELIEIAGGLNAYEGSLSFPRLSREAIIYLNPEIIIDIIPGTEDLEEVRRDWLSLTSVEAIKNNRLFFLTDESDTVPGPRIDKTLKKISLAFHPDPEPVKEGR